MPVGVRFSFAVTDVEEPAAEPDRSEDEDAPSDAERAKDKEREMEESGEELPG